MYLLSHSNAFTPMTFLLQFTVKGPYLDACYYLLVLVSSRSCSFLRHIISSYVFIQSTVPLAQPVKHGSPWYFDLKCVPVSSHTYSHITYTLTSITFLLHELSKDVLRFHWRGIIGVKGNILWQWRSQDFFEGDTCV